MNNIILFNCICAIINIVATTICVFLYYCAFKLFDGEQIVNEAKKLIVEKEKEIDTLTAKLEQADEIINNPDTLIFQQQELIDNLQKTIEEKNKEIEQLKKFDDLNKTFFGLFRTAFKEPNKVEDLFNTLKTIQEKQDQDKISFALEQLDKVKNKIESKVESIYKILDDLNIRIVDECTSRQLSSYEEIVKDIDNQIKELKEKDNV